MFLVDTDDTRSNGLYGTHLSILVSERQTRNLFFAFKHVSPALSLHTRLGNSERSEIRFDKIWVCLKVLLRLSLECETDMSAVNSLEKIEHISEEDRGGERRDSCAQEARGLYNF